MHNQARSGQTRAVAPDFFSGSVQRRQRQSGIRIGTLRGDMTRLTARFVLMVMAPLVLVVLIQSGLRPPPPPDNAAPARIGDLAFFQRIVQGQQAGGRYYAVYAATSREHAYPLQSVFNWRTPFVLPLVAWITPRVAAGVLVLLAIGLLITAHPVLRSEPLWLLFVLNAAFVTVAPGIVYFGEVWAGWCLALSVIAFARQRERAGVAWGLVALLCRELAAPYCVLALLEAVRERRWRQAALWIIGGGVYLLFFVEHVMRVNLYRLPTDAAQTHSWLYGGGLPFVAQLWQVNGLLMLLPRSIFAVVFTVGLLAYWAPAMPRHLRLSVLTYSALFSVIGLPFNLYWGHLLAPLLALWLTYTPAGLRRLWTTAAMPSTWAAAAAAP
jgi:hypothetical protein